MEDEWFNPPDKEANIGNGVLVIWHGSWVDLVTDDQSVSIDVATGHKLLDYLQASLPLEVN